MSNVWHEKLVEHFWFYAGSMVEHKQFNYLYLSKLGKLANSTKKNFGKPKFFILTSVKAFTLKFAYLSRRNMFGHLSKRCQSLRGNCRHVIQMVEWLGTCLLGSRWITVFLGLCWVVQVNKIQNIVVLNVLFLRYYVALFVITIGAFNIRLSLLAIRQLGLIYSIYKSGFSIKITLY